jgi:hypothetical protein
MEMRIKRKGTYQKKKERKSLEMFDERKKERNQKFL